MANRMLKGSVICLMASVSAAVAATQSEVNTSMDGRVVFASPSSEFVPGPRIDDGLVQIYNNFSQFYPLGRYWCCGAYGIGNAFAVAIPFTPAFDATVTKIVVAVGSGGGNDAITMSVNEDAGGLPGDVIQSFQLSDLPNFGACCAVEASNANIPVAAGTQYWLVVAPSDETTQAVWNWNVTNQSRQPLAWFTGGVWKRADDRRTAFAILGTK